jgi:beta-lactamase class A
MNMNVPQQATTTSSNQTTQNLSSPTDLSTLSSDNVSDMLKRAALRYQLDQIVNNNENQRFIITSATVQDLLTGQMLYNHNQDTAQFAASLNKIPIAWFLLQDLRAGKVHMTDSITWTSSEVSGGYGFYDQPGAPTTATVQELVQDMLNRSGNTAVRILVNHTSLGGPLAVNQRLAQYPKLVQTRLQLLSANRFFLGNTTSSEGTWLMEQLQSNKDSYEQFMQNALATNIFTDFGVRSQLAGNSYIQLANKVGILDDTDAGSNRHDEGIIYNSNTHRSYAYSLMTTNFSQDLSANAPAEQSLKDMGLVILRFAGDKPMMQPQAQAQVQKPHFQEVPQAQTKILY